MMYWNEHMKSEGTVIAHDWDHATAFMKALWDISNEKEANGEYAFCVTEELGVRIDFKWISYEHDAVVFCSEIELDEMFEDMIQDSREKDDDYLGSYDDKIAYSQGDFDDGDGRET